MMKAFRACRKSPAILPIQRKKPNRSSWPIFIAPRCIQEKSQASDLAIAPPSKIKLCVLPIKNGIRFFWSRKDCNTQEVYVNGVSSSLPFDVQIEFIHSIPALRNAEIMRPAYAIEYDYVVSGQIDSFSGM